MVLRLLRVTVLLAAAACTRQLVDLVGRPCTNGECADGFVCNPLTSYCSTPVRIDCSSPDAECPSTTTDGDTCATAGTFLPCAEGTTTCESGCRLCQPDDTWGACSNCFVSNNGVEVCDGFDNDCDGTIDGVGIEGCIDTWVDNDGDLFGVGDSICSCGVPAGRARYNGDPDDTNKSITPGGPCDGVDSGVAFALETDDDGDGYVECQPWIGSTPGVLGGGDCYDDDPESHPGAPELCDGVSNACGSTIPPTELDGDGDHYVACAGFVDRHLLYPGVVIGVDCAPSNPSVHPGALELWDNNDNDCDGKKDECLSDCDCGPQLVSCYPLNAAPTANDQGPANVDATDQNAGIGIIPGVVGSAFSFGPDIVEGASSTAQDLNRFTLSMFVRPTSFPVGSAIRVILDVQSEYGIEIGKLGNTTCFFADGPTSFRNVTVTQVLAAGTWQHLGCTYNGKQLILYVDGLEVGRQAANQDLELIKTGVLRIGSNSPQGNDNADEGFEGGIDHLKIFNLALTAQQMCAESHRTNCP